MEKAGEGAGSGIGMQLHLSGCQKPLLFRLPSTPTCPVSGPRGENASTGYSHAEKVIVTAGGAGAERGSGSHGLPALPETGPLPPESRLW